MTDDPKKLIAKALSYTQGEALAPQVSAEGERLVAEEILKIARRYGVPIKSDSELAEKLGSLETEDYIPEELYEEIALLFASIKAKKAKF